MANVSAIPDGKEKNAASGMMSARWPIVLVEAVVQKDTANASKALRENFAKKVRKRLRLFLEAKEIFL